MLRTKSRRLFVRWGGASANRRTSTPFEFGLGGSDASVQLALEGPGSTIYASPGASRTTDAQIRDVVGVLDELSLDDIDLCKVNIEGGEYDLFDRLIEADWLRRIRILLIQFHEWHPKAYTRRRAIRRALSPHARRGLGLPVRVGVWRRRT